MSWGQKITVHYEHVDHSQTFTEEFFGHDEARTLMKKVNQNPNLRGVKIEGSKLYMVSPATGLFYGLYNETTFGRV